MRGYFHRSWGENTLLKFKMKTERNPFESHGGFLFAND